MKFVIFGLSIGSTWNNRHATLWRSLVKAMARHKHRVVFFERDTPAFAEHRDCWEIPGAELVFYRDWASVAETARRHADDADAAMVTSGCPDAATALVLDSAARRRVFYDLDTVATLASRRNGDRPPAVPKDGLGGFDLVLGVTGGRALEELRTRLGARAVAPLPPWVDPDACRPTPPVDDYLADLSHLGDHAADRRDALERLLVEPARRLTRRRFLIGFLIGGGRYPDDFPWAPNIGFVPSLPASGHSAFLCSATLTLHVTREPLRRLGWCPSVGLFEAAACGAPIISDAWDGLPEFFEPGREILVARDTDDVTTAMQLPRDQLTSMARRARERTLSQHTAERRLAQLRDALEQSGRA